MRTLLLLVLLSAPALAQSTITLVADQAASNFNWSGTTTLGPIVGDPSTAFQVSGTNDAEMSPPLNAGAAWSSRLAGGDLLVVPDIHGEIPNPLPFLPPLAEIRGTNLRLSLVSPYFDVAPNGSFTVIVTANMLSGTFTIVPLTGTPSTIDLTGTQSSPTSQAASFTPSGTDLHLTGVIDLTFPFSDPTSGVSGSFSILGTLNADWACPPSTVFCTAKTTSSGCVPTIGTSGTPSASAASGFTISTAQVEPGNLGIFFFSWSGPAAVPFQGGFLCLAPPVIRLPPSSSGGAGACSGLYSTDFNAFLSTFSIDFPPGSELWVQTWFRDPPEPISGSGLSDAVTFSLCP